MNFIAFFRKPMVLFTLSLFVLGIFIPMAIPGSLFDSFNTTGEKNSNTHGLTVYPNFDTANIIGAFTSNADSETFTITGTAIRSNIASWTLKAYRYKLYVDGSDSPVKKFPSDDSWISVPIGDITTINYLYYLQSWTTSQKTSGDVRLKVVIEYKSYDSIGITHEYTIAGDDSAVISWDGANVLSGSGAIYLPASEIDKSPFEAGETTHVFVKTGFTGGAGWTVMLRPPADRTDLLSAYQLQ